MLTTRRAQLRGQLRPRQQLQTTGRSTAQRPHTTQHRLPPQPAAGADKPTAPPAAVQRALTRDHRRPGGRPAPGILSRVTPARPHTHINMTGALQAIRQFTSWEHRAGRWPWQLCQPALSHPLSSLLLLARPLRPVSTLGSVNSCRHHQRPWAPRPRLPLGQATAPHIWTSPLVTSHIL
jgi:hypothetical protein